MQEVGDIVNRNNIIFPDNGKIDIYIDGRPTLNITTEQRDQIYFLRMSGTISSYSNHSDKMVIVRNTKSNGLSKPSVVKVDHIMKEDFKNQIPQGCLSNHDYNNVIDQFHKYQKTNTCLSEHCACCDYELIIK